METLEMTDVYQFFNKFFCKNKIEFKNFRQIIDTFMTLDIYFWGYPLIWVYVMCNN